jgi:SAM-dependent methyltransferase
MREKTFSEKDLRYFNQFTSGYTPYRRSDLDAMLEPMDYVFNQFEKLRICEIGCASGQFSQALAGRYPGRNISLMGLDIAMKVLSFYPYGKICGSAFSLPFKNECFEMACLPATLHHLFPIENSLVEISRILVPGGVLYCMEPNLLHPQRFFFMRFPRLYQLHRCANDVPVHPGKLKAMLENMNFKVIACHFVNIHFKEPSILQGIQNFIADRMPKTKMSRFWLPWFILIARKAR